MRNSTAMSSPLWHACLWLLSASVLTAQTPGAEDAAAGQAQFQKLCAACHGGNAQGGRGPNLTSGQWRYGGSDTEILKNIMGGIPNTGMPAFPMQPREGEQIVAYLRSLGPGADRTPAGEEPKGDPAAGRALFFGSAGCSRCHMFGGQGGRLGPDLSLPMGGGGRGAGGGRRSEPVNVRQAILNPDETIRRGYETVEVRLANGQLIRGVNRNR